MTWSILSGDCLERLADLDDDSIDAVVTDPPYGLSAEPDAAEVLRHWLDGDDYQHRGGGFMGKSWDSFVPGPTVWKECLRVLKPGGHLVAFFGTRTVDLGGMAIRLAGFEIRDCLAWHYGSGFPKSLDVSKAMDKAAGAEREVVGTKLGLPGYSLAEGKGGLYEGGFGGDGQSEKECEVTAPATDLARQWQGWGTALKPAFEPVILARKPLIGTVAENVTRYGTGALNVDGCRVEAQGRPLIRSLSEPSENSYGDGLNGSRNDGTTNEGRWPANLILDEEAAAMLDEQSGDRPATGTPDRPATPGTTDSGGYGDWAGNGFQGPLYSDTGGASRFFYQAKASRAERNAGLDGFEPKPRGDLNQQHQNIPTGSGNPRNNLLANVHPTVKPIDLMRWLVRLVTPPGGTVLDPFTGSGTTGIAAGLEGFDFVGIEREAEYREIAEARLKWWGEQEGETAEILHRAGLAEKERERAERVGQASLFDEEAA